MKRLLSVILALSMVLSLIPATYASAETGTNDVVIDFSTLPNASATQDPTDGSYILRTSEGLNNWRNDGAAENVLRNEVVTNGGGWPSSTNKNRKSAISINIPASGYYSISFKGGVSQYGCDAAIYMDGKYLGDYSFYGYNEKTRGKSEAGEEKKLNTIYLEAGYKTITFNALNQYPDPENYPNVYMFFHTLTLDYLDDVSAEPTVTELVADLPAQTMGVGETHALTADVTMNDGSILYLADYNSDGSENTADRVEVTSNNEAAVKVTSVTKGAEGNAEHTASYSIEAVAEGNATLTYTLYQNNAEVKIITKEVTVGAAGTNDVICDFDAVYDEAEIAGSVNNSCDTDGTLKTEAALTAEKLKAAGFSFSLNTNGLTNMGWSNVTTDYVLRADVSPTKLWPHEGAQRSAILNVDIPVDGYYSIKFQGGKTNVGAKTAIFIDSVWNTYFSDGTYLGDYDFTTDDTTTSATKSIPGEEKTLNTVYLTKGTHTITFLHSESPLASGTIRLFFHKLSFIYEGTEKPAAETLTAELPTENMEIGGTEDLTASVTMSDGTPLYMSEYRSSTKLISNIKNYDTANYLAVTSENSDIVKVTSVAKGGLCNSENTNYSIEAVAGGTTKLIYTLYRDGEKPVVVGEKSITVNTKKVKLMADINGDGNVTGDELSDVSIGVETSVTATPADNQVFAYWTDADGGFVSENKTYKFTPYTNTVLVAVFRDKTATAEEKIGVEFFNRNRDYLGFVEATSGTSFGEMQNKPTATLVGYKFLNWSISESTAINGLLSAVAMYEEDEAGCGKDITGDVKAPTAAYTAPNYGQKITEENTSAKAWTRTIGGKDVTVGYGTSYTYYVWDETEIKAVTSGVTKAPLVVLDDVKDSAYMIEYDIGNAKETLEAGILFGDADSTVDSCYAKAKVKEISNHGQFTAQLAAKSSELQTHARGYLIYKDANGVVKTIYTAAVEIQ